MSLISIPQVICEISVRCIGAFFLMTAPALALEQISKSYGATQALFRVSLDVRPGEVHAIVGENGAGKSTLINIISGNVLPDQGRLLVDGVEQSPRSAHAAQRLGIATVHQELSVVEHLTVAENIFAAHPPTRLGLVRWNAMADAARHFLRDLGLALDVKLRVGSLPVSARQLVEIAKAVAHCPRILLFDEPTSALNGDEKEALFELIASLRSSGIAIIYISHHLDEVMRLSDRVSVLRDGQHVGTFETAAVTPRLLVNKMVGREIAAAQAGEPSASAGRLLSVSDLSSSGRFAQVSFDLAQGEIVGLAGLMGSGRSALASCLAGLLQASSGTITWEGQPLHFKSLRDAMKQGIAYVPGERKTEGLFLDLSIAENIVATDLNRASSRGLYSRSRAADAARRFVTSLRIKTLGPGQRCGALSGGNQQKVLLAKWIARSPRLLIIEEPTKGVDIAAKDDIHRMLRELAQQGTAILFVSSDLPEILSLSHRVLVMHGGQLVAERSSARTTEEEITALASGFGSAAA